MSLFVYHQNQLYVEQVPVTHLAERFGTPCYVYSRASLENNWRAFDDAFGSHPHRICYSVKALSNIAILDLLAKMGSGFDVVSQGEWERVLVAGGAPHKIVFSGVGKTCSEIEHALEVGIACFNIESLDELARLETIAAKRGAIAPFAIRVNPHIHPPETHPGLITALKESKFGVPCDEAWKLLKRAQGNPHLKLCGLACHIGSQITELAPFLEAFDKIIRLADKAEKEGIHLEHLDCGGGVGVSYQKENVFSPAFYVETLLKKLSPRPYTIVLEPGRRVAASCGILLTRVEYLKTTTAHRFAVVDAGMNDFIRPALYSAWHDIIEVVRSSARKRAHYDIVGPVCESTDCFGKNRLLSIREGDLLAILSVGAYGFTMSSNYNSRRRPPEILVDGKKIYEIRAREEWNDLWAKERMTVPGF
ncbi:MAG: diaminopimelate decarboxylase [Gammaproteobacteria bacterium]|nr:diaminopimelate decarboxylase [Gammaproteobacteria bacterium]